LAIGESRWPFLLENKSSPQRTQSFIEGTKFMKWILTIMMLGLSNASSATTYYVSSSTGSDANAGTSSTSAWQTIAKVNGQTFQPGDSILFKRGDVWNESLVPPSSGSLGNTIAFDAYGSGAAPNLTGYYSVPTPTWVLVTGNAWKAPVPAAFTTINFCLFGSVWGQKVAAASSNLTAQWDFYLANGYVYVYSQGNPFIYYGEPIVPMALSNVPVINIIGRSWLTFQHFLVNWFDQYGVYVEGGSDHLVFANMEADSMIPQGTQPLGFYVNESAPGPGDIKIYNAEAHLNYDGFRFDGAATGVTMVNDKAYANRDGALVDNTSAVTYSYCHFYASSLAVAGSTDVLFTEGAGPIAGAGNIAADTQPVVQVYQRYPAEVSLTVDDAGMTAGADTYYANTVLPVADAAGVPVGVAITVGYPLAQTLIPEFQGWVNAGRDVTSHSISHTYYTNTDALEIQYTGSGTAATLSISNKTLTILVTGASDSVTYNLAQGQAEGTIKALRLALLATGKFTATENPTCQGPYGTGCSSYTESALLAQDLADASGQDVKSSVYHAELDVTRLTTDEITLSRQWMTTSLTGLPATPVYVYPGGFETTNMQGITASVPYIGARGALKEDLGVKDTYADGFDVQNITSFGVNPSWMGVTPASLNQKIQALVWKESVWGVPWGIFWHLNELTNSDPVGGTEITNLIQDFKASGATIQTNTGLVNWLLDGKQETGSDGNYYYVIPATSMTLDFRPTKNSPVVDAGLNLGVAYEIDINGVNQNSYGSGWEIGAHVYDGYTVYGGGAGGGAFSIGNSPPAGMPQLPLVWVDNNEATDGLVDTPPAYELNLATQSWVTGPPSGCTGFSSHFPYWTAGSPTISGLTQAIADDEACRTAHGGAVCTTLDLPAATFSSATGLLIPQSSTGSASCVIILRSAGDSSLPNGRTVCAHGIQDNLNNPGITDIGLNNPTCDGKNMYYALGPQSLPPADAGSGTGPSCVSASMSGTTATFALVSGTGCNATYPSTFTSGNVIQSSSFTPSGYNTYWTILSGGSGGTSLTAQSCTYASTPVCVSGLSAATADGALIGQNVITGITQVSANTTTLLPVTSANVGAGIPVLIPLANGYVSPSTYDGGGVYAIDTLTNPSQAETVTAVSGTNQIGIFATFTKTHTFGASVVYVPGSGSGGFTLANGGATNITAYNDVASMYTIESTGNNQALQFCTPAGDGSPTPLCANASNPSLCAGGSIAGCPGPDHWLIEDGEFRLQVGNQNVVSVILGGSDGTETTLAQLPSHVHFRKNWVHCDWYSLAVGSNACVSGILFAGVLSSEGDNYISGILHPGTESHGIGYGQGAQGMKIYHNWIEGGSIGSICGGIGSTGFGIPGIVPCNDVEWRRNRFTMPFSWLGIKPVPPNPFWPNNFSLFRKNVFEVKEQNRTVLSGNIFENADTSGGQQGPAVVFDGSNASGGGQGSNYQSINTNYYVSNNVMRNSCVNLLIGAGAKGGQGGVAFGGGISAFPNNLWYNITSTAPGCSAALKYGFSFGSYPTVWGTGTYGTLTRDSTGTVATFVAGCSANPAGVSDCPGGTGGLPYAGAGMSQSDIKVGDYIGVGGCTGDTSFNTPFGTVFGGYSDLLLGTVAATGTTSNALTIVYSSAGMANSSDTSGNCRLYKRLGWTVSSTVTHNTDISDKTSTLAGQDSQADGANFATKALFRDSIFVSGGGWQNTAVSAPEGTSSEKFNFDVNTLGNGYTVWPTRNASLYTEYNNNPAYPLSVCNGAGCNPPITMYFPASSCIGWVAACSSAIPLTLTDYHGYALSAGSTFAAGGTSPASDGTSMGANIPAIDGAQTINAFVCPYACGSPGPYPD
jgi:hypothetical protein